MSHRWMKRKVIRGSPFLKALRLLQFLQSSAQRVLRSHVVLDFRALPSRKNPWQYLPSLPCACCHSIIFNYDASTAFSISITGSRLDLASSRSSALFSLMMMFLPNDIYATCRCLQRVITVLSVALATALPRMLAPLVASGEGLAAIVLQVLLFHSISSLLHRPPSDAYMIFPLMLQSFSGREESLSRAMMLL